MTPPSTLIRLLIPAIILSTGTGCACNDIARELGWCTPDEIEVIHHCHKIHVQVVDEKGTPVRKGQVQWYIHGGMLTPWHDVDSNGRFTFTDLPGTNTPNRVQYRPSPNSLPIANKPTNPLNRDKPATIIVP